MNAASKEITDRLDNLPYMPEIALKVSDLLDDPDTSVKELHNLISTDPALTARILALANSSFYGRLSRRKNLQQALTTLGMGTLKPLVLAFSVQEMFDRFGLLEKALWEHSMSVSIAAASLAQRKKVMIAAENALLAGLIHDIGKMIISSTAREEYRLVIKRVAQKGLGFCEAEKEVFGLDHTEVGCLAVRHWRFPEVYESVVRYHHTPEKTLGLGSEAAGLTALVSLANSICIALGFSMEKPPADLVLADLPATRRLGFTQAELEPLLEQLLEEIEEKKAIFI